MATKTGETVTPTPTESTETEAPKVVTPEDVHSAISDRLKRWETKLAEREKALEQRFQETLKGEFAKFQPAQPQGKSEPDSDPMKAVKDAEARFKQKLEQIEAERAQERQRVQQAEERTELQKALAAAGVTEPARVKAAMAVLYTEEKRITRGSDGKILFKHVDKFGEPNEFDLEEGVKAWANSDEGKFYVPPKPVAGSGASPQTKGARPGSRPAKQTQDEAMAALFSAFRGGLR